MPVVVFPWATTLIIQAGVWKFIIDTDYGTLNTLLLKLGTDLTMSGQLDSYPQEHTLHGKLPVGIFVTIPFVTFTVYFPVCRALMTAYYEAATVDGANYWQKLFQITHSSGTILL